MDLWDSLLCVENPFQWDISWVLSEIVYSFTNLNANNANQVYWKNLLPWIGLQINTMNSWHSLLCHETLYRMVNEKCPVEPKAVSQRSEVIGVICVSKNMTPL